MTSAGFEPIIPTSKQRQIHTLDRAETRTSSLYETGVQKWYFVRLLCHKHVWFFGGRPIRRRWKKNIYIKTEREIVFMRHSTLFLILRPWHFNLNFKPSLWKGLWIIHTQTRFRTRGSTLRLPQTAVSSGQTLQQTWTQITIIIIIIIVIIVIIIFIIIIVSWAVYCQKSFKLSATNSGPTKHGPVHIIAR